MTEQLSLESDSKPVGPTSGKQLLRQNLSAAQQTLGHSLPPRLKSSLKAITEEWGFSLEKSELLILGGSVYVTHTGLLHLARRRNCSGIAVEALASLSDSSARRYVLQATVYPSPGSVGFSGLGDADPCNVSLQVRGAELRIAETRAVNRALRKAYGIGLCSAEEMGSSAAPEKRADRSPQAAAAPANAIGSGKRVRDRLRQIVRQHKLDPAQVKAYAVDCCGAASLKDAPRERVESFVEQLAEQASNNRASLLCQLNSYAPSPAAPDV